MVLLDPNLEKAMKGNIYLKEYIDDLKKVTNLLPKYYDNLSVKDLAEIRKMAIIDPNAANVIYKIGNGNIHIDALRSRYVSIEHKLDMEEKENLRLIKESILEKATQEESVETKEDLIRILEKLYDRSVDLVQGKGKKGKKVGGGKVQVNQREYDILKYYINRDIVGYGPIEPLILDPYIEDIHLIGTGKVRVSHKAFQFGLETNVRFDDDISLNEFFVSISERMGRPVSASRPIVDGTLPDGSRINMIYSNEISARGSSCTIRKFSAEPISPIQLIKFGTVLAGVRRLYLAVPREQDEHHLVWRNCLRQDHGPECHHVVHRPSRQDLLCRGHSRSKAAPERVATLRYKGIGPGGSACHHVRPAQGGVEVPSRLHHHR